MLPSLVCHYIYSTCIFTLPQDETGEKTKSRSAENNPTRPRPGQIFSDRVLTRVPIIPCLRKPERRTGPYAPAICRIESKAEPEPQTSGHRDDFTSRPRLAHVKSTVPLGPGRAACRSSRRLLLLSAAEAVALASLGPAAGTPPTADGPTGLIPLQVP
jgi:hypothetical protein